MYCCIPHEKYSGGSDDNSSFKVMYKMDGMVSTQNSWLEDITIGDCFGDNKHILEDNIKMGK